MSMPTPGFAERLRAKRLETIAAAERWTASLPEGKLSPAAAVTYRNFVDEIRGLAEHENETRDNLQRAGTYPLGATLSRSVNSAGRLAPLSFDDEQLRKLHRQVLTQNPGRIESRAFESASGLLPAELYPTPTFPVHDARILDRLQGYQTDAPSLEVIQVGTVTGAAAIVAEGALKPEILMPPTRLVVTVQKLAAHTGIPWESIQDWDTFSSFVRTELTRLVVDLENHELVYGDGTTGHLTGLLGTSGILVHAVVAGGVTSFDDIEQSISLLRTGPALAEPDLAIFHPATWSAIRREKNLQGSYYAQPDPTSAEPASAWGVPVLVSTAITAGDGILVDTRKFGRVAIRETLGLRIGYSGDDLVRNVVRTVCEERLALLVERPSAVLHITGLPAS